MYTVVFIEEWRLQDHLNGLQQDNSISIANTLEMPVLH